MRHFSSVVEVGLACVKPFKPAGCLFPFAAGGDGWAVAAAAAVGCVMVCIIING